MNIVDECRSMLEAAGYRTALSDSSQHTCYFEDESVLGAVFVHSSLDELLDDWEKRQDRFLGTHSGRLRTDPVKAWNIYTIHLTADPDTRGNASRLFEIEQDFRGTRKIVRTGVNARSTIKEAILPLLGLQHRVTLSRSNLVGRLRERLALSGKTLVRVLDEVSDADIAAELMEGQ
jgi:hypothetical protein